MSCIAFCIAGVHALAMTDQPKTWRPPAELYAAAKQIAAARNETIQEVLVAALRRYVKRHQS